MVTAARLGDKGNYGVVSRIIGGFLGGIVGGFAGLEEKDGAGRGRELKYGFFLKPCLLHSFWKMERLTVCSNNDTLAITCQHEQIRKLGCRVLQGAAVCDFLSSWFFFSEHPVHQLY